MWESHITSYFEIFPNCDISCLLSESDCKSVTPNAHRVESHVRLRLPLNTAKKFQFGENQTRLNGFFFLRTHDEVFPDF
ncbi:hypothetical protein RchiOBHm_Chr1g0324911 [Rosa chinensis]|uniref:Uncharacterized protein n=1 Tax=Rosa chinensis TaxID=74649 RepID=A0A2P6S9W9_ROSCH|nr:hypothetical protein RchiOBHm_Chr1g0324911 [Rosa chinensis]